MELATLNENQLRAVVWDDGPLLVLAGPGSGKTRVLAMRVARVIKQIDDAAVLALTFTTKAAAEMRERVDLILGERGDRAHLATFHSYATEVLRQHGSHLGLKPDFTLLTLDEDRLDVLNGVATELEAAAESPPRDRRNLLTLLDHLFREAYDGGPVAPGLPTTPPWVPKLFKGYCDSLVRANRQDFGSLLYLACKLLRNNPSVARVIRVSWTHVCVDEFQDTNKAQYDFLKMLVPPQQPNLFLVGDDDQILYQWNGASPERLQALMTDFEVKVLQLPENYRCPPEIVDIANNLIAHNKLRVPGKQTLLSRKKLSHGTPVIRNFAFETPADEAKAVALDIQSRGAEKYSCAVLGRTTRLLEGLADALRAEGIVPYLARKKNDFDSPLVRTMLASLRVANARHDRDAVRRLCNSWLELSGETIEVEAVAATASLAGGDFLRAWAELASPKASGRGGLLLERIRNSLMERLDFPDVVEWFLVESRSSLRDESDRELEPEIQIWEGFHGEFVREHGRAGTTLNAYLQSMDLASKVAPPPVDAVHCLTVHGSKGLEFRHVYLVGMAQEVLPSFQALKKGVESRELEEERRNCFVACTRARETLTLTRARQYYGWSKGPSQFLREMGLMSESSSV